MYTEIVENVVTKMYIFLAGKQFLLLLRTIFEV